MLRTLLSGILLAASSASTAGADSIQFHHPATFVPASQSFDGVQYWNTPHGYRDHVNFELACAPGRLQVDAIDNRNSDTYDQVSFSGTVEIRSPDGFWTEWSTVGLSLKSPWLGGHADNWWLMRVTGSGSFRPCDYVDPERKSTRRCYPVVHFTFDASEWLWVYRTGQTWPWPWNPAMNCSV